MWTATATSCVWCGVVRWGRRSRRPATANKSDVRGARRKEDACLCVCLIPRGKEEVPRGRHAKQRPETRRGKEEVPRGKHRHTQKLAGAREGGGSRGPRGTLHNPRRGHTQTRPANTPRHTPDTPRQHTRHTPATHPHTPGTRPDTPATRPRTHPPSRAPDTPRPPPVRDRAEGGLRAVSAPPLLRRLVHGAFCVRL